MIDSFLNESGDHYSHPLFFCLAGAIIVVALNTLIGDLSFNVKLDETVTENENLRQLAEWTQVASVRAATQFLPLSMFFVLIVSLAAGGMLFLRGKTGGFYDKIIINTYAVGASFVALPLLIPVWQFSGESLLNPFMNSTLPAMVVAGVILWIYRLYFNVDSFMDWIRVLSAYITGFVIYVIITGFMSAVVGYVLFAVNRLSELAA